MPPVPPPPPPAIAYVTMRKDLSPIGTVILALGIGTLSLLFGISAIKWGLEDKDFVECFLGIILVVLGIILLLPFIVVLLG